MWASAKEYLRLSVREGFVLLGGAVFTVLGFIQHYMPSWGWFLLALSCAVWMQFRSFDRVRRERDAALRDPREIAEIRTFLQSATRSGEGLIAGLQGDLGAVYSQHAKSRIELGTRSHHIGLWRANEVRSGLRGYLPGRVAEFDALGELPPEVEYGDPNRLDNADEFNMLIGRLVVEVRWLDQLYLLTGLNLGGRKSARIDP
ncbi:MAG TPA: hypothetical protein VNC40_06935 [Gaiellaceae bacterium]|nr:hypothetical protein [Gaiellaceae bacterium]